MGFYWLISVPKDDGQEQWNRLLENTKSLSSCFKFNLPSLKVGTLDALMSLSDDLQKLDQYTEQVMVKVYNYMAQSLEDSDKDRLRDYTKANNKDLLSYCGTFQWDMAKFPIKLSIKEIHDIIAKNITKVEKDFKTKSNTFNSIKMNLAQHEKKETGSLLTRNLAPLVKEDDFVISSEYLVTVCVVVHKSNYKEWEGSYWKLADFVVPGSSKRLLEDGEMGLYTVTMFRKTLDSFKNNAREKKFTVREFQYNKEKIKSSAAEIENLKKAKNKAYVPLIKWLKGNFSEVFVNWVHIKALRLFTESVLRYGLPATFMTAFLEPNKKSEKKLRDKLHVLYGNLDTSAADPQSENLGDIPGVFVSGDFYPYVYFDINTSFIEAAREL